VLPNRCRECAINNSASAHASCRICVNTEFDERILCDLNRSVQQEVRDFECHVFQPMLEVIGSKKRAITETNEHRPGRNVLAEQLAISKLWKSDKIKYQTAWALQQMERDPNATVIDLKYHYAWNVKGRRCLFVKSEEYFDKVYETFSKISIPSVFRAQLLWLAPDHIHIYCEEDGERCADDILVDLKSTFEKDIAREIPELAEAINPNEELWDDAYFVETIG
jgi:REP element-mobilizing transposase RayT